MPSFSIPLSGLSANNTALNTIANNLSNMNTTAYKEQTVTFSDLFYQQVGTTGANNPEQVGSGVKVGSIATDYSYKGSTSTSKSTDMTITGTGYFVVQNGTDQEYTRAGNFTTSNSGNLITQSGYSVMGYPAVNGTVSTTSALTPITLPLGSVLQPNASTETSFTGNLNSSDAVSAVETGTVQLYDSLGNKYDATITYTKTASNTWSYNIALPSGAQSVATSASGTLSFDNKGNLSSFTDASGTHSAGIGASVTGISFAGLTDGSAPLNVSWNLFDSKGGSNITQVSASTTFQNVTTDGYASGKYSTFNVDSSGVVSAKYDNGLTKVIGQLAVASVTNEQGLSHLGDGNYATTLSSGSASIGLAGAGGRGSIQQGSLESSNVDISTEFANLIVAQRAFQANSKAVTTFDTVSETTINMIR